MRTLQEHIDDLDRMVDGGAEKPKVRSQIAFIGREVAALEADYARLAEAHSKLQATHSELEAQHTALKDGKRKAGWDALQKQADDYERIVRSKDLDYGA
ncbi:MAG: hypothetical protein ABSH38_09795 [Verrucomicrobiota bacterium]|jgi:chromosome segregation ATPase